MRILRVDVERLDLTLIEPYTIAYETVSTIDNLLVRIVTEGPHVGLGIAAPDVGVTGELCADTERALVRFGDELIGRDPLRRIAITEDAETSLAAYPSARAAIDQALIDLLGKVAGMPFRQMLGGYRVSMPTSATVFLCPPSEGVERALAFLGKGFRLLKIKGGDNVDVDIERLHRIREAVGPHVPLLFDANQGYDAQTAYKLVFATTKLVDLALFEQPCPADQISVLRQLTNSISLRVAADESLLNLADAFLLARGDVVDMVNIKLAKVGGLDQALLINAVAKAAGLQTMVGCMDECALSIAAGLAFALSRPNVEYADLDAHFDVVDDPSMACLSLADGLLIPSDQPGFGLRDLL
jgi:L-Ala-D/L-Glu epimerase